MTVVRLLQPPQAKKPVQSLTTSQQWLCAPAHHAACTWSGVALGAAIRGPCVHLGWQRGWFGVGATSLYTRGTWIPAGTMDGGQRPAGRGARKVDS